MTKGMGYSHMGLGHCAAEAVEIDMTWDVQRIMTG